MKETRDMGQSSRIPASIFMSGKSKEVGDGFS